MLSPEQSNHLEQVFHCQIVALIDFVDGGLDHFDGAIAHQIRDVLLHGTTAKGNLLQRTFRAFAVLFALALLMHPLD